MKTIFQFVSAFGFAALVSCAALAKPAECFSTDDGYFDCDFIITDSDGSFEAHGAAVTHSLVMDSPGRAFGYVNFGDRNISLPGVFVRETSDRACWRNVDTGARLCAW